MFNIVKALSNLLSAVLNTQNDMLQSFFANKTINEGTI